MSRRYETEVTVSLGGVEQDVAARGNVAVEWGLGMGGGQGAVIDGGVEVQIDGRWVSVDDVQFDEGNIDEGRIEDALCEAALEDDS